MPESITNQIKEGIKLSAMMQNYDLIEEGAAIEMQNSVILPAAEQAQHMALSLKALSALAGNNLDPAKKKMIDNYGIEKVDDLLKLVYGSEYDAKLAEASKG